MKNVWASCIAIAVLYIVEAAAFTHALHYSIPMPHAGLYRLAAGIAALLQSGAIYWLYRVARSFERVPYAPLVACAAVMSAASFAFINPQRDALAYIAYAKQPTFASAYLIPPNYVPPKGFETIRQAWPSVPGCSYGPLWLWIARATAGLPSTLEGSMLALRIVSLFSLVVLFASVLSLRAPPVLGVLTVANPFWYFFYVLEAHNDGLAIVLAMAAMALALTRPLVAAVVAGLAALIKAPFVLIAALAFASARSTRGRMALQLTILVVVAACGSLLGGAPYFEKLFSHGTETYAVAHSVVSRLFSGVHIVLAIVAVVAIVLALAKARFQAAASLSFVALSTLPYPWYLGWGLPYAVNEPFAIGFLALLPVLGFLMNSESVAHLIEAIVLIAVLVLFAYGRYRTAANGLPSGVESSSA